MLSKKKLFLLLSLLAIFATVYHEWLFSKDILSYGDWRFFFNVNQIDLYSFSFLIWRSSSQFGSIILDIGQSPINFLYGFFAKYFFLEFNLTERLIHFWPVAIITPISILVLLKHHIKSNVAVFIGVLAYCFNTYFLADQTGHLTLLASFAFAPLVLYFYEVTLEKSKIYLAFITGILYFILGSYEPRSAYIVFGVLFLYFIFYLFTSNKIFNKLALFKKIFYGLIPFIVFGFANIYWVYTLTNLKLISSNTLFSRELYGGNLFTILYSFTIFHPFWTGGALKIFTTQPIIYYFWIYPLLAIVGLFINRKNKKIVFFGLIALIGIFLSKQSDIPFINTYQWLYNHFPGFNAFREASKFYFLTALGYSVLIAAFFDWIWENWKMKRLQIYAKYIISGLIIFTLLWNTKPLITGEIGTVFVGRKMPEDFLITENYILKQNGYFRILWTPTSSRWSIYSSTIPQVNIIDVVNNEWNTFIDHSVNNSEANNIINLVSNNKFKYLINNSSIRYVIVSTRTIGSEEDWIGTVDNRTDYIKALDKISYLKKLAIGTKQIAVYENINFKPHIYLTLEKESLNKYVPFEKTEYSFIDPTRYKISLKHVESPFFLNFSESYHPNWRIRVGEFNWFNVLTNKNYFLSDKSHFANEQNLNSFYIDPKTICSQFNCIKNTDGSYDIYMTLYFTPQSYLDLGMIVSGTTLVLCLSYLIYYGIKKTKTRK